MSIHGYTVTALLEGKCLHHCTSLDTFHAADLQNYILDQDKPGLTAAAKKPQPRWRIDATEIANRVADRLIQKWRKLGLIVQHKRGTWDVVRNRE